MVFVKQRIDSYSLSREFTRHLLGRTTRPAYPRWVGALDLQDFDAEIGINQLVSKVPPGLELSC